jgi:polyhydroxyalkanoate synthesis regulator phasin
MRGDHDNVRQGVGHDTPIADCAAGNRAHYASGSSIVPKRTSEAVERIVEELMDGELSKAERIQRLRDLARSGENVPDELMDKALRKLMERITDDRNP